VQSHGQEENLTFVRKPSDSGTASPESLMPQAAVVTGIYDFAQVAIAHGQVRHEGDELAIFTDPLQWAYTAVVPLGVTERQNETGRFSIALAMRVDAGVVQIGILNRQESDFPAAAVASASPHWQEITLITPPLDRAGPLVIRNASDAGSSQARCRLLSVTRLSDAVPAQETEATPSPEEASYYATQLLAAAAALGPLDPAVAPAIAPELRSAIGRLRTLLARNGIAAVGVQASEINSIFAGLDEPSLYGLAVSLAVLAPLYPVPGWRFDSFLDAKDLATFVRYALWLSLSGRRPRAGPVTLPWHASTRVQLHMGNDLSQAVFVAGCFEPNEFALLERVLRPGMTMIDGGANEGVFTIYAAVRVGAAGRVLAVEPSPRELDRLRANLALNEADNVTVVAAALAERLGELSLRIAEDAHAGQNTLGDFMYPNIGEAGKITVPVTTLDALVEKHRLGRVDVIKLDLEGAEERALAGARRTLREFHPLVLLEAAEEGLTRQGGSTAGVCALLAEEEYNVLGFHPGTGKPAPVSDPLLRWDSLIAVHRDCELVLHAE
jgi:FkbM family methyltransferase